MAAQIQTEWYCAIPPAPRHAITIHLPKWSNAIRFMQKDPTLFQQVKSMYPRIMPHKDVKALMGKILELTQSEGKTCIPFARPEAAAECVKYATAAARKDSTGNNAAVAAEDISVRIFDVHVRLWVVFIPAQKLSITFPFWIHSGVGISTRLAEDCLKHVELLHEVAESDPAPKLEEVEAQGVIRERIAGLLERALLGPPRKAKVSSGDVYLFQTGMASIYVLHQYLMSKYNAKSVLFGFAFHSTPHVLQDFGPGSKHFGNGTPEELEELEAYLKEEAKEGRKIQALYTEVSSNPNLATADLSRLRKLADTYEFILVVDDTVGSFCNVDVLGAADIVVTSLTKSFSGYADVMGGSVVLNPSTARYSDLKTLFKKLYHNALYNADAEVLEGNSRDYMSRSATLNNNALKLVEFLQSQVEDPKSSVVKVFYPTTVPSRPNYEACKRSATEDFTPGYGCLFSFEFDTVEATAAWLDTINLHVGPHLGAHLTLVLPFVKGIYGKELDWAAKYGLNERQIRVSVGLEDTAVLIEEFKIALKAADQLMTKNEVIALT